jgi:hypothetical protein
MKNLFEKIMVGLTIVILGGYLYMLAKHPCSLPSNSITANQLKKCLAP